MLPNFDAITRPSRRPRIAPAISADQNDFAALFPIPAKGIYRIRECGDAVVKNAPDVAKQAIITGGEVAKWHKFGHLTYSPGALSALSQVRQ